MRIMISGGGIGGLTLALALAQQAPEADVHVYESAAEFKLLGLGINLMPHAIRVLTELGLQPALRDVAVEAHEFAFYTSNGQHVYSEPTGLRAGHQNPHFSIHRGDLHDVLYTAAVERLGADHIHTGHRLTAFTQNDAGVRAEFAVAPDGTTVAADGDLLIGADGLHSAVRKQLYPDQGDPVFHGINMWRGVTRTTPFLSGASATRIGALHRTGKLVVYPIRDNIDGAGTQLVNWVAEVVTDEASPTDWSAPGRLEDFIHLFEDWQFDWLDCNALIRHADSILSYPMADRDPIEQWTFGRVTLLGDAAHPMYPRGGNGAAQAILDADRLAAHLATNADPVAALADYEAERLPVVNKIVLTNRSTPPDTIIDIVEERTGGGRFEQIDDVITPAEIEAISGQYQAIAGYGLDNVTPS